MVAQKVAQNEQALLDEGEREFKWSGLPTTGKRPYVLTPEQELIVRYVKLTGRFPTEARLTYDQKRYLKRVYNLDAVEMKK